ncbi:MAG: hypothetical protein WCR33_01065 [Bacilli bacterium]
MKKSFKLFFSMILVLVLLFTVAGCKNDTPDEPVEPLKVLVPNGSPLIGFGSILDDTTNYDITTITGPDLLTSAFVSDDYDVIISGITLGAKLYTLDSTNYRLSTVFTEGNVFILSRGNETISDLSVLEGKNVIGFGESSTPGIVLKTAITEAGGDIEKVNFTWENGVSDAIAVFNSTPTADYVLSSEPVIATMQNKVYNTEDNQLSVFDVCATLEEAIPQAGIFVNKDCEKSAQVTAFLNKISENITTMNEDNSAYADSLLALTSTNSAFFGTLGKEVLVQAIPGCNLVYHPAKDQKAAINAFITLLNEKNPAFLNGKTVDDDFYY